MLSNRMVGFIIGLVLVIYAYAQAELLIQPNLKSQESFVIPAAPMPPAPIEPIINEEEIIETLTTSAIKPTTTGLITKDITEIKENGINIGLSTETRQKVVSLLNKLLSDEFVLYTKTLKFHWNVQGIVFHDFHQAFKEQYEKLFDFVDSIAERARALGAPALGSLNDFSTYTRLKEVNSKKLSALEMIKELLADHEAIIRQLRDDIEQTGRLGDQGTNNFLQDLIVKHEKIAWMLRATAQQ